MKWTKPPYGDSKKQRRFIKKLILQGCLLSILLLTACNKKGGETDNNPTPTIEAEVTITPSETPTTTPSPTPTDATSNIDDDALLTEEDALSIIESRIDLNTYSASLMSNDIVVDGNEYYGILVKEKNVVIEPPLAVNKVSGEVFCLADDGTLSDYSNFPLYNAELDAVCDWNGLFERTNSEGTIDASIELAQGDSSSFEFTIKIPNPSDSYELFGIARIQGNTAKFSDDTGFTLNFVMNENKLVITKSGENPADAANVTFSGSYSLTEEN